MSEDRLDLQFVPMTTAYAAKMARWIYEPPYDIYGADAADLADEQALAETIGYLSDPASGFFAGLREPAAEFVAFVSFGEDARVPGGDYTRPAVDVGFGLRPDLTGRGWGGPYLRMALDFGRDRFHPPCWRATLAAFNERVQTVCARLGFVETDRFKRPHDGREFLIVMRELEKNEDG